MVLLNYADPLNTTLAEWVEYSSINGSKELQGVVRGSQGFSAKAHDNSVVVAFPFTEDHINRINEKLNGADTGVVLNTPSLTSPIIKNSYASYSPSGAGTTTLDLSLANTHTVTMPANTQTLAISNATTGQCFIVEINNVTSQGALTWFTTIRWAGGSAPTLTGTNGKRDVFGFRVTGTGTYDGFVVGQNL